MVPLLQGETVAAFEKLERVVQAYVSGIPGGDEERKAKEMAAGPLIYKNLLALNNSVSIMLEQHSPGEYHTQEGWKFLLSQLKEA
eukprot:4429624-Prorocentrum_lima.AAC.1